MAEPISSTAITAGTMIATGGLMTDLVIFNDSTYLYLALTGAFVSMFGVVHELFGNSDIEKTRLKICAEICKGLVLGILAIPFWYLSLCAIGANVVDKILDIETQGNIERSVWLMVSFAMSWYTVPIFDWLVLRVRKVFR